MSRIGKRPVEAPNGVEFKVSGQTVEAKGPKGTRTFTATDDVDLILEGTSVLVKPRGSSKRARQQWGMSRTMIANLAQGVSEGFKKELEINGVGYRAQVQGKTLNLNLLHSRDFSTNIFRLNSPRGIKEEFFLDHIEDDFATSSPRSLRKNKSVLFH